MTAAIGMCTKFVEVAISHKYRDILPDGSVSGGPMYYMKKRLNITTKSGKVIKTGAVIGAFFAAATVLSSFGTGSLPQINSISNSIFTTFGVRHVITGAILSILLALIIIGGIKRIAKVTEKLIPGMAIFYFFGAIFVIITNYENIIPSLISIVSTVLQEQQLLEVLWEPLLLLQLTGVLAEGSFQMNPTGICPIAHSSARASEPVSEGMVAILEPLLTR